MEVDLIDVFLDLLSVVLPKRVGKQSLGFVLDVMLENLRFKIQHFWELTLLNCFLVQSFNRYSSVIAVHLPHLFLNTILKPDAHHPSVAEQSYLQLMGVVCEGDPLHLSVDEVPVDDGSVEVNDEAQSMNAIILEVANIGIEGLCLKDAESISLIGTVDHSLVDSIDKVDADHLAFIGH